MNGSIVGGVGVGVGWVWVDVSWVWAVGLLGSMSLSSSGCRACSTRLSSVSASVDSWMSLGLVALLSMYLLVVNVSVYNVSVPLCPLCLGSSRAMLVYLRASVCNSACLCLCLSLRPSVL